MSAPRVVLERSGPERPWVGQLVRFDVQLWRPQADAAVLPAFSFGELEVPGAIALFRPEAAPPESRTDAGVSYLVQHRTLLVFPQTDGKLSVPPITARWTEGKLVRKVSSRPLELQAAFPGKPEDEVLVAPKVLLSQSTDRALSGLRVGDGFTRRVVLSASDTDPVVLPSFSFEVPAGLGVYPLAPRSESSAERGELSASRTFTVTYVVERVGHYELPALTLRYLEPGSGRYLVTRAPELSFWAWPNPSLGLSMWGTAPGSGILGFAAILLLAGGVGWIGRRRLRGGPFGWETRLQERRAERRAFAELLGRVEGRNAGAVLAAAYAWLRLRLPERTDRTLRPLRTLDAETASALAGCERLAYASADAPDRAGIKDGLQGIFGRARALLARRQRRTASSLSLGNAGRFEEEDS